MKNPSVYLKMRVLGAIDTAAGKTQGERVRNVAGMTFTDEEGNPRQFTWRTIYTWYYRYKNHGITSITRNPRRDKGKTRKTTPEEVMEAVNQALPHFQDKKVDRMNVFRFCIENGLLNRNQIAQTTFYRFCKEYDLLKPDTDNKLRRAFSMAHANELWQGDTMFGPYVKHKDGHRQTKLIAFIDDASRVICHGEFFLEENIHSLIKALKAAFYKRGLPEQLYVDNGSIYCSSEITLICARIGCILRHTPVRDAASKGKIERFFRRVRSQFLSRNLDLSSLEALNRAFTLWVEDEYNALNHSAISMKPIDRFGLDRSRLRFLSPTEAHDELFYAEKERTVKKDNTFSFKSLRFETPVDLRGKKIQIRYDRTRLHPIIIYYKGERMGQARRLDPVANGKLKRKEHSS